MHAIPLKAVVGFILAILINRDLFLSEWLVSGEVYRLCKGLRFFKVCFDILVHSGQRV